MIEQQQVTGKELRTLSIDPEFRDLIPPLSNEERGMLEDSIVKNGCDLPLIVWNGVIVDGHNRYAICQEHSIPFAISEKEFESRDDALLWIITTQLGRRNLTTFQRGELVIKFEPLIKAQAKERQIRKPIDSESVHQKSDEQNDAGRWTLNMLGKLAGVSHDTIHKVKKLSEAAGEETKTKLRRGEVSINRAYTGVMHKEHADQTKGCDRCEQEKPVTEFAIHSNRHGFSALCRDCEKEVAEASRQAAETAKQTTQPVETQPITVTRLVPPASAQPLSSVAMHKGHPIHVGAPLPDRKDMFHFVEDHMRFVVGNFLAAAGNAIKLYTSGMASPDNTQALWDILGSAADIVDTFDEYVKEMNNQ